MASAQKELRTAQQWFKCVYMLLFPKGKIELLYPLSIKKKLYAKAAKPWPCPAFSLLPSNFQPKKKKNPFNFLISCLTGINAQIIMTVEQEDTVLPC